MRENKTGDNECVLNAADPPAGPSITKTITTTMAMCESRKEELKKATSRRRCLCFRRHLHAFPPTKLSCQGQHNNAASEESRESSRRP